jgi:hypothetical protein
MRGRCFTATLSALLRGHMCSSMYTCAHVPICLASVHDSWTSTNVTFEPMEFSLQEAVLLSGNAELRIGWSTWGKGSQHPAVFQEVPRLRLRFVLNGVGCWVPRAPEVKFG